MPPSNSPRTAGWRRARMIWPQTSAAASMAPTWRANTITSWCCIISDASANRRQFQPPTPTDLGRGSEGLVLRLRQGGVFFEQLKSGATCLLQTGSVVQNVADAQLWQP